MLSFVNNFQLLIICMIFHKKKNNFLQYVKYFELGLIGACFALQGLFFLRVVSSKGK